MFGVFQTYYQTALLLSQSASNISWIGSMQGFLLLFGGAITGPSFDLGYLRTLLLTGTLFSVLGMMLMSICHAYWQFFLAQGVVTGIGFGCLFLPSAGIISQYFTTKGGLAYGIAASGSSIGKVTSPYNLHQKATSTISFFHSHYQPLRQQLLILSIQ
jgi:MFS family permease